MGSWKSQKQIDSEIAEKLNKLEKQTSREIKWIDVKLAMPTQEGKYVVKTTTMMGNPHKVECHCSITKNKASFNVSNQIVTHWLKEN